MDTLVISGQPADKILLTAGIIVIAYIIRGIAGFGSGLIAIPLLALMLPLTVVVPLVVLLDYLASLGHGLGKRDSIQWQDILPLLPFSLIGVVIAILVFTSVDAIILSQLLGGFVILFAIYTLLQIAPNRRHGRYWAIPAGTFGGLVGTLFGTGGPFYVIYLKLRNLDKVSFRASFASIFLLDGAARLIGYSSTGMYTINTLILAAACIPVMLASLYLGGRVHTNISQQTFQRVISVLLLISGTALLTR